MTDRSLKDLGYGHPGAATFDIENQEWSFVRQYTTKQLKQVQSWTKRQSPTICVIPTSMHFTFPRAAVNHTSVQKVTANLTDGHPQLAPAVQDVSEMTLVSAAIQNTTAAHDPLVGNLLSFGSIAREDMRSLTRRVVALATGEARNILQLCILNKERHGWEGDRTVWVQGPTLKSANCGYWNEDAAPIQQVCFSQSDDRSSFLAVRLPSRTVILRPVFHKQRRATKPSTFYHLPASIIDAHPVLSIGTDQTGDVAHADIAFNPDFQRQFGIINQDQTWSIWDIEHGYTRTTAHTVSCLIQGRIPPLENGESIGEDGWGRILWIGDVNTVLVCSRRHISIVSLRGASYSFLPCPSIISDRSSDWVLDVQRHPRRRGSFLVLTSTHLALMAVHTSSGGLDNATNLAGADVLVSWKHFRDREDFTLQLSIQMLSDDESCCFLHSRLSNLIQVFNFKEQPINSPSPFLSSDPRFLDLKMNGSKHINQLFVRAMKYGESSSSKRGSGPGRLYMEKGITFHRLFATRSDLSLHETVIYTSDNELHGDFRNLDSVEPFRWNILKHCRRDIATDELIDEMDEFIEPNERHGVVIPQARINAQKPKRALVPSQISLPRELDYGFLYGALSETDNLYYLKIQSVNAVVVLNKLKDSLLDHSHTSSLLLGTLLEVAGMQLDVTDIDEASSRLQELYLPDHNYESALIQHVASSSVLGLDGKLQPSMTDLYDDILNHWVKPLPSHTSNRVRQRKERFARRIAAEVMMASFRIRHSDLRATTLEGQNEWSTDDGKYPTALQSESVEPVIRGSVEPDSSQPLPTLANPIEDALSQSVTTSSQSPSVPTTQLDPLARLGRHLRFKDSSTTPTIIPPSVNQLLAHWQLGSDPHTYDWDEFERALQSETLDEGAQEQREKDRRRRERKERRQQREDEMMRGKSTSQPISFPRSSPGPMLGGMESSSQIPSQLLSQTPAVRAFKGPELPAPMSQIEPGRFGGRPDNGKQKKKGRVSGF